MLSESVRGLQPGREQLICGLCTHPAGAVDETLERDLETSHPAACELHVGNVSFLVQDGWELLSPQHTSYKSAHFSYRHSGKWS